MREINFKQTEAGMIPVDWNTVSLCDIFEFGNGYTPSKAVNEYWNNGNIPWFRVEDIRSNGNILSDSLQHITPLAVKGNLFPSNSFIISTSATVGEYAYVTVPYLANQRFVCLIKMNDTIDDGYFLSLCQILGQWCRENCDQGSSFASVNMPNFRNHEIPVPPLDEQHKIAKALSDTDGLISYLTKLIEKKQNIKTATMQQLLTGKKRLEGFTEPWVEKTVEQVFDIIGNNCLSRDKMSNSGIIRNVHYGDVLIKFGTIINAEVDELPYIFGRNQASHPLCDGDIIMADTAEDETCGKVCEIRGIGDTKIESGLHTIALRPKEEFGVNFLGYYMNSSAFHNLLLPLMQGTKVTSISKSALMEVSMTFPSDVAEQKAIADILTDMDAEISSLELKRAKYESIKKGMMQELLTGKIRLV